MLYIAGDNGAGVERYGDLEGGAIILVGCSRVTKAFAFWNLEPRDMIPENIDPKSEVGGWNICLEGEVGTAFMSEPGKP